MIYCFDSRIAVIHGVAEAVIYEFLMKNVLHNKLHNVREQDGNYWTPLSFTAMNVLMPFFSVRQISTAVGNLVDAGLVLRKKIKHNTIYFLTFFYLSKKHKIYILQPMLLILVKQKMLREGIYLNRLHKLKMKSYVN